MTNAIRRISTRGALLSLCLIASFAASASAQDSTGPTPFQKQLAKIDLGVTGVGMFSKNNSGTTYLPQMVSQVPSNTFGYIIDIRYIKSPLVGIVYNYGYARYTDNFTVADTANSPKTASSYVLGVQTKASEFTLGYVAHLHSIYGLSTFAGAGAGAIAFRPTTGGGEGVPPVFRSAFYYNAGLEGMISEHFGLRAEFRQVFFGAPDYNQNYLATGARSNSIEPGVGFFIKF